MISWNDFFFFFTNGTILLLCVLGLWFTVILPGIDPLTKRLFRDFFVVLFAGVFTALVDAVLSFYPVPSAAIRFLQVPECLLLVLPLPLMTFFLVHCSEENLRQSRLLRAVICLWTVYCVLVASGLFTEAFFFVASDRQAHRGPWYSLMLLPVVAITVLTLSALIKRRKLLSRKIYLNFLIALLPITFAVHVQLFMEVFPLIHACAVIFALSVYGFILSDQTERDLRHQREIATQQQEIANQRASIMVLQMRPHFIYNTMASIYCLCGQDPEKAQQVVMDFTTYLRKNFTAVVSDTPVPFTSELDHTRAYLAVEQTQYSKSLIIEYDTPYTFFRVPPLTLQPIVENAIKHGRDPNAGPLSISIRTRKTDSGTAIIVEDNGPGFDPSDESKPHTTLNNIRQRLEMMCEGGMTIMPREGGGTVVTIRIPLKNEE